MIRSISQPSGCEAFCERSELRRKQIFALHSQSFGVRNTYTFTYNVNCKSLCSRVTTLHSHIANFILHNNIKKCLYSVENTNGKIHAHGIFHTANPVSFRDINATVPGHQVYIKPVWTITESITVPDGEHGSHVKYKTKLDLEKWKNYCTKDPVCMRYIQPGNNFTKVQTYTCKASEASA